MLRSLLKLLLRRAPAPPVVTGLVVAPANIPVPANDPTPITPPVKVRIMTTRTVLRFSRNDTLALPGTTVTTRNNAEMKVARVEQKPPYVICVYRGRRLAVRADNIGCYWAEVSDLANDR